MNPWSQTQYSEEDVYFTKWAKYHVLVSKPCDIILLDD